MRSLIAFPVSLLLLTHTAVSQETNYQPDMIFMDGQVSLAFPNDGHLSLMDGGTVEFWVAPNWEGVANYNPVILSNYGDTGLIYEIAMQGDKQAINVTSADQMGAFTFNFDDGAVHHVAIINLNDSVVAMVDGNIVGTSSLSFENLEPEMLQIGSGKDGKLPFTGAIGAVRIWGAAIDPETLIEYNWQDVRQDSSDPPFLGFLSGYSEFETDDFVIIDRPVVPTWLAEDENVRIEETPNE